MRAAGGLRGIVVLFIFWVFILVSITKADSGLRSISLRCYQGSVNNYSVASLRDSMQLLNKSSCYNSSKPTTFFTFGYSTDANDDTVIPVISAYLSTQAFNVFLVDWSKLAAKKSSQSDLDYLLNAAPNTKEVGEQFADTVVEWIQNGFDLNSSHLVGHSLGSHVFGSAGRHLRGRGYTFPRITGLDPSHTGFEPEDLFGSRLQAECALFVDIIHTSPSFLGIKHSYGTVDIWVNYDGRIDSIQPGCPAVDHWRFTLGDLCSHRSAVLYYSEAITHPRSFPAAAAINVTDWIRSTNKKRELSITYLGEETDLMASGNYYLTTNGEPPYGRGVAGLLPNKSFNNTGEQCIC